MGNSFRREISNTYLHVSKTITGKTYSELMQRIHEQEGKWRVQETAFKMQEKAEKDTAGCLCEIQRYNNLLSDSLQKKPRVNWDQLYRTDHFAEAKPNRDDIEKSLAVPLESKFLEFLFPSLTKKRLQQQSAAKEKYDDAILKYNLKKMEFYAKQKAHNKTLDQSKENFKLGKKEAVEPFLTQVLTSSEYPIGIVKKFNIYYNTESEFVVVDYHLPNPEKDVPKIIEYKYVQTKKEIVPKVMKQKDFESFYEDVILQICLRTIKEIFDAVANNQAKIVVFNGWVNGVDRATGKDFTSCIVSLQATQEQIKDINWGRVHAKDCFRSLKGRNAGALYNLAPVQPILKANLNDERFVESKEILAEINSIPNLAEMDWEDFEHLVRELFELMFKERGAEVKVTRCSHDWGIDAVIFDPDPIYGGKFIIQAKRWNILTSPSNVRDLYGTMMHEQASRGILVTTSWFGPESYEFANGKQLTLINGQELLGLLDKFGYNARITLRKK